jgi:hypothetical protein
MTTATTDLLGRDLPTYLNFVGRGDCLCVYQVKNGRWVRIRGGRWCRVDHEGEASDV